MTSDAATSGSGSLECRGPLLCSDSVGKLCLHSRRTASMNHAASCLRLLLATHFATSYSADRLALGPGDRRTRSPHRLVPPCRSPPLACHPSRPACRSLRELGRIIVEWTFNHLEPPTTEKDLPGQIESGGTCKVSPPLRRPPIALVATTLQLDVCQWRMLDQDVHGVEPSIFPLEIRLGLESGRATPALAECAAHAAVTLTQDAVLATLRDDHGVRWSVATLRTVIAGVAAGMEAHPSGRPGEATPRLRWSRRTGLRPAVPGWPWAATG